MCLIAVGKHLTLLSKSVNYGKDGVDPSLGLHRSEIFPEKSILFLYSWLPPPLTVEQLGCQEFLRPLPPPPPNHVHEYGRCPTALTPVLTISSCLKHELPFTPPTKLLSVLSVSITTQEGQIDWARIKLPVLRVCRVETRRCSILIEVYTTYGRTVCCTFLAVAQQSFSIMMGYLTLAWG